MEGKPFRLVVERRLYQTYEFTDIAEIDRLRVACVKHGLREVDVPAVTGRDVLGALMGAPEGLQAAVLTEYLRSMEPDESDEEITVEDYAWDGALADQ